MARHLPGLQYLSTYMNKLGREGVTAVASSLTKLGTLNISNDEEIGMGASPLGRLPILKKLYASNCEIMQVAPE